MLKKILIVLLLVIGSVEIKAEEKSYYLYESTTGGLKEVAAFGDYQEAASNYEKQLDNYGNLVLKRDDKVFLMEYVIVAFNTNDTCTLNLTYDHEDKGSKELNGCYGVDALYVASKSDHEEVTFKMSDTFGKIAIDDVTLYPYELLNVRISEYTVNSGELYHDIKAQLNSDYYAYHIKLDKAPSYLSEGSYFSYDGHYFYDDFYKMSDDVNKNSHAKAVNTDDPYYNYYMYLPHRSLSSYDYTELETYFEDNYAFKDRLDSYEDNNSDLANDVVNRSQYVDTIEDFFAYQNIYGANALLMLSLSILESSYGKNAMAYDINNLFGHLAFDSDEERSAQRYSSVVSSIYSHARYFISNRYSNPKTALYNGSFFGNFKSGMNVEYAIDPYFGEKTAANYYELDLSLGLKDHNAYALGISNQDTITIYNNEYLNSVLLRISDIAPYSMIILQEGDDYYKVQFDRSNSSADLYDFEDTVGYVAKNTFQTILNKDKISEKTYHTITFDADGGSYDQEASISIKVADGKLPAMITPQKDGYEFNGYDKEIAYAKEDTTYKAEYKKIASVEVISEPSKVNELHQHLSLKGGKLKVTYEDGTSKEIAMNTNMIKAYDVNTEGESVINGAYCGIAFSFITLFSKDLAEDRGYIKENLKELVSNYQEYAIYDEAVYNDLIAKLKTIDYPLEADDIRVLDEIAKTYYEDKVSLAIDDNHYDLNVSGMYLALDFSESLNSTKPLFKDTYRIKVSSLAPDDKDTLSKVGEAYKLSEIDSFNISFYRNYEKIASQFSFVISIKIDDLDTNKIYTVYRLDENGDVYKCKSSQTEDYVQFVTFADGDFMIFAVDSSNAYNFTNVYENLNDTNDDDFYFELVIELILPIVILILDEIMLLGYLLIKRKGDRLWKDYKNLLQSATIVHEEKPKN